MTSHSKNSKITTTTKAVLGMVSLVISSSLNGQSSNITLENPSGYEFLFTDLDQAAACLNVNIDDCDALKERATSYDVAYWIGDLFCEKDAIPSCADSYALIDGLEYTGVLAITKETIREPWIIYDYSGQTPANLVNHRNSDWSNTPGSQYGSNLSLNRDIASLSQLIFNKRTALGSYMKTVSSNDLYYFSTQSKMLSSTNITSFRSNIPVIPSYYAEQEFTAPIVNIPSLSIISTPDFNSEEQDLWEIDTIYDINSEENYTSKLYTRLDPFPNQENVTDPTTKVGFYNLAPEYQLIPTPTLTNLLSSVQFSGAHIEIDSSGDVYPEFAKAFAILYQIYVNSNTTSPFTQDIRSQFIPGEGNKVKWKGASTYPKFFSGADSVPSGVIVLDETTNIPAYTN